MVEQMRWLALTIVCLSTFMSGCSTTANFARTPVESTEFTKSLDDLKKAYSDIEKYDRTFASPASAPREKDLEGVWGEPTVKKKWGEFLTGLGLLTGMAAAGWVSYPIIAALYLNDPVPREEYTWNKGNYEITAAGRSDAFVLYEKRIHKWKWNEKNTTEQIELSSNVTSDQ